VFVDGAFWHGKKLSASRLAEMSGYWQKKIANNVARDSEVDGILIDEGWTVLRIDSRAATRDSEAIAGYVLRLLTTDNAVTPPTGVTLVQRR